MGNKPDESGPESNGNEEKPHTSKISRTGTCHPQMQFSIVSRIPPVFVGGEEWGLLFYREYSHILTPTDRACQKLQDIKWINYKIKK